MSLKVSVPKALRWRCPVAAHPEIVEMPNPCSSPVCCVPWSDWVCSTVMITVEEYDRRRNLT